MKNLTCSYQYYEFTYKPLTHATSDSINIFSDGDLTFSVILSRQDPTATLILTSKETVIQLNAQSNFHGYLRYLKFYLNAVDSKLQTWSHFVLIRYEL